MQTARIKDIVNYCHGINWDEWWNEFLTSRESSGAFTYPTSWSFCRAKTKDKNEQKVIYWRIGPKPTLIKADGSEGKMPVTWLGEWQSQRSSYFTYSSEKIQALKKVLDERQTGLDAALAAATFPLDWMAKTQKWSEQIDSYFKDLLMDPGEDIKKNGQRANLFLDLQKQCFDLQTRALKTYLMCNGVTEDDISVLAQVAAAGGRAALEGVRTGVGATILAGAAAAGDPTIELMMRTFAEKKRIYNLQAPEDDIADARKEKTINV